MATIISSLTTSIDGTSSVTDVVLISSDIGATSGIAFTTFPVTTIISTSSSTGALSGSSSITTTTGPSSSVSTTSTDAGILNPSSANSTLSEPQTTPTSTIGPTDSTITSTTSAAALPTSETSTASASVTSGATAGIAIACLLVGLAIGAVAAFFLLRRRQRRVPQPDYAPVLYPDGREKDPVAGLSLDQFLLDSKPDAEIATELRNLGALIQQHVENNYHLQPVHVGQNALAQTLASLGLSQRGSLTPNYLATLALDPRTRYAALQHVIARVTFESTTLFGHSPISLLPGFVPAFTKSVPPIEQHRGNPEAVNTAFTKWRQLSAFLLHPSRSDRTPLLPSEDTNTQQAQQLTVALSTFLEPFALANDRESRYEQENHLREVIVECAHFGYVLFSQPSEYKFRYESDGRSNGIVVSPGLEKITDEAGRRYPSPEILAPPLVEAI